MKREVKLFAGLAGAWFLILIGQAAAMAQSADDIAKAVLPLPEDLRADAAIYVYDEKGDRKILRPGNNMVECMPKNPEDRLHPLLQQNNRRPARLRGQTESEEDAQSRRSLRLWTRPPRKAKSSPLRTA